LGTILTIGTSDSTSITYGRPLGGEEQRRNLLFT
jgi:hypothetical protein